MNEANLQALELLLERALQERDRQAAELRRAEEVALRTRRQGEQLAAYRGEYTQRWNSQFGRRGAIEIVHCYQSFMQRLDEALLQQSRQIEQSAQAVHGAREALVQAEVRVASIRKLIERRRAEAQRERGRHEQRLLDETCQQIAFRRPRHGLAVTH